VNLPFQIGLAGGFVLPILALSWLLRRVSGRSIQSEKAIFWSVVGATVLVMCLSAVGFADGDYRFDAFVGIADILLVPGLAAAAVSYVAMAALAIWRRRAPANTNSE
jgi:hypothetical protein